MYRKMIFYSSILKVLSQLLKIISEMISSLRSLPRSRLETKSRPKIGLRNAAYFRLVETEHCEPYFLSVLPRSEGIGRA